MALLKERKNLPTQNANLIFFALVIKIKSLLGTRSSANAAFARDRALHQTNQRVEFISAKNYPRITQPIQHLSRGRLFVHYIHNLYGAICFEVQNHGSKFNSRFMLVLTSQKLIVYSIFEGLVGQKPKLSQLIMVMI